MVKNLFIFLVSSLLVVAGCQPNTQNTVRVAGAMKNVMKKGDLSATIQLDTISTKEGLYGLGPLNQLQGELLIVDGVTYISKVNIDSSIAVSRGNKLFAPFFVYGYQSQWKELPLSKEVHTLKDVEHILNEHSRNLSNPFIFRLEGAVKSVDIHVQNLPVGAKVSSPKDAHQGQKNYHLTNENVEIIGFYSTRHHGIFTHHDTNIHAHLLTKDKTQMGHLDALNLDSDKVKLYVPK